MPADTKYLRALIEELRGRKAFSLIVGHDEPDKLCHRAADALASLLDAEPVALPTQLNQIGMTLNFFASVIKSGEGWTKTCQTEFDFAHACLAQIRAAPVPAQAPDGWQTEQPWPQFCATFDCLQHAARRFEAGGVGSWYCEECYAKIATPGKGNTPEDAQ